MKSRSLPAVTRLSGIRRLKKEALEREIREMDDAIDKKVYALYGLTNDEIKIIEEQCKK